MQTTTPGHGYKRGEKEMQAHAYNYQGKVNKINKDLGSYNIINIDYIAGTSALRPTLRYTVSDSAEFAFFKWNYIILNWGSTSKDWGNRERRYFVEAAQVRNVAKGVWEVPLRLDSLSTFAKEILNSTANVERSASNYNLYLNDNFYNAYAYPRIGCKIFPSGFNDNYNYLLTVCNTLGYAEGGTINGN